MRPNLSVEKIAGALAVLGTGVLMAACGGAPEQPNTPVDATEIPTAGEKAADGASHCAAGSPHKAGEAECSAAGAAAPAATTPATTTPPSTTGPSSEATPPADAEPAEPKGEAEPTKAAAEATSTAAKPKPKKTVKKPAAKPKKGGAASCGAGTCAVKK